ncbi:MAG: ADP-forming succinate--CoA ligase subunit beta [Candidatus Sericytochromatia bacterium]|nr:ADP-forming succinate--CoA ligase subunit beta [Candidatus Sericytochromatia bacterium]
MKLHEYQGSELFSQAGIPTGAGHVVTTIEEVEKLKDSLGDLLVIKAQVHVGGRGKAGGVKLAKPENAVEVASKILGMDIKGLTVKKILVKEAIDIDKEYYLGVIQDRANRGVTFMASVMGGVDIEEVAVTHPDKIIKVTIDPSLGLQEFQVREIVFGAEFPVELRTQASDFVRKLYKVFMENDCTLAEINPLVVTKNGQLIAADAKVETDDNADFRHPEWEDMRDLDGSDKLELDAKKAGLSYVELDGDIGCVVNGAGLAMATMDVIKYNGGKPANFLDIGGSSNPDKVVTAMNILMAKPLKAILFNIFGGITRCDDVARGLITAFEKIKVDIPVVIRLTGTNEEVARDLLEKAGYKVGSSMDEAIKEVVALANNR